jgi:ribosome-associated protein
VKAIADAVRDGLDEAGVSIYQYEGYRSSRWVVLDYVDVVVHVFHREERSFYSLERLWGDAKRTEISDEPGKLKKVSAKTSTKRKPAIKKRVVEE